MSSPSLGIRSKRRNCIAIWSSSAQRRPSKSSLLPRITLYMENFVPSRPQRGVNGSQEVALGTHGQAHGCLLTSHSPSLQGHLLTSQCSGDGGSCPILLAPIVAEGKVMGSRRGCRGGGEDDGEGGLQQGVCQGAEQEGQGEGGGGGLHLRGNKEQLWVPPRWLGCGFISAAPQCLTHSQDSGFESITGWFLLRGASSGDAGRMSSWRQLLQCHHHPGAEMAANGTHTTPLAADWPHISAWSHTASSRGRDALRA